MRSASRGGIGTVTVMRPGRWPWAWMWTSPKRLSRQPGHVRVRWDCHLAVAYAARCPGFTLNKDEMVQADLSCPCICARFLCYRTPAFKHDFASRGCNPRDVSRKACGHDKLGLLAISEETCTVYLVESRFSRVLNCADGQRRDAGSSDDDLDRSRRRER